MSDSIQLIAWKDRGADDIESVVFPQRQANVVYMRICSNKKSWEGLAVRVKDVLDLIRDNKKGEVWGCIDGLDCKTPLELPPQIMETNAIGSSKAYYTVTSPGYFTPIHADPIVSVVYILRGHKQWDFFSDDKKTKLVRIVTHPGQVLVFPANLHHAVRSVLNVLCPALTNDLLYSRTGADHRRGVVCVLYHRLPAKMRYLYVQGCKQKRQKRIPAI
jgi:hypothetical protein